jgi:plastocyanin
MYFSRSVIVSALMGFAAAQSSVASAQRSMSTGSMAAGMNAPDGMAPTHVIQVGGPNGSLTFSPNNVMAKAGELVQFQFHAKVCTHNSHGSYWLTTHAEPLRRTVHL